MVYKGAAAKLIEQGDAIVEPRKMYVIDVVVPASSSAGKVFVTGNQPSGIYVYVK